MMNMAARNMVFTLIELLVVIAVIAILLTLLFPGLKTARDAAKRISCMNNLKQTSYACQMYVSDYGKYPTPNARPNLPSSNDGDQAIRWWRCLGPYMSKNWPSGLIEAQDKAKARALKVWGCPGSNSNRLNMNMVHYGMNVKFDEEYPAGSGSYCIPSVAVKNNGAFLFGDRTLDGSGWSGVISNSSTDYAPDPRHTQSAMFSFIDCHVAGVKYPEYLAPASVWWNLR